MTINHNGYKIWKASSDDSDDKSKSFRNKIIMAVMAVCVVLFIISIVLNINEAIRLDSTEHFENFFIKALFISLAGGLVFIYIHHRIIKQNPKRYAFIKSPYGEIYIIDYNTPFLARNPYNTPMGMGTTQPFDSLFLDRNKSAVQIDMINRMKLFEALADRNMIMPYGKKILRVHTLKSTEMGCYIYCTATDGKYAPKNLRVLLPDNYPDLDELIMHLEALMVDKL